MPKKHRKRNSKVTSHTYRKMTDDEIHASREKIGISTNKTDHADITKECQAHDCTESAKSKCSYCGREFCNTHLDPRMAATAKFIWSLDKSDYEKYNKYQEDWQRKDGHPCVPYSEKWNRDYNERTNYKSVPKWGGIPTQDRTYRNDRQWTKATYPNSYNRDKVVNERPKQNKSSRKIIIVAIAIIATFILGFFILSAIMNNGSPNNSKSLFQTTIKLLGTQSDPFQPNLNHTIKWQGPGYYLIPVNVPATGLVEGTDLLSNETQVNGYNLWVIQLYNQTTVNTTSTVLPTTIQSTISTVYTTTISQTEQDGVWATQLFENISSERGSQYNYCSSLSQFAKVRFNTMAANYGITHYGYSQDFSSFYGTIYNTYFAEEVFYPNLGPFGDTPSSYTNYMQSEAPLHWKLITNNTYSDYGYYIQNGPNYVIYGPDGGYAQCPVTELPGPNINISQFFAQYGCTVAVSNETWFVIELASSCP